MKTIHTRVAALLGTGSILLALPALAAYPALFWWRQPVSYSVKACFKQAEKVMKAQGLQEIEVGSSDVYGHTDDAAVAITCFQASGKTQVVIMVTGGDTDEVKTIDENLKRGF